MERNSSLVIEQNKIKTAQHTIKWFRDIQKWVAIAFTAFEC